MNKQAEIPRSEVYDDLNEFKQTKNSVAELIRLKQSLGQGKGDQDSVNALKDRAMNAIDHLFSDPDLQRD